VAELTKTVDGSALTADKFAYVGDAKKPDTWHLPLDTKDHIHSALSMFAHTDLPASGKEATARQIASKAKDAGFDTTSFCKNHLASSEHADFNGGWVEIFRAGNYGDKGSFTPADLDRVIRNYDPSFHEAPACVGHPKDNTPAFGWASRLMRDGDMLLAKFSDVDPAFEQAVKARRYPKRSAAFYLDGDGRITNLRHVGFLGGMPPEVKGLKNLNFSDGDRQYTSVEFGEEESVANDEKSIGEAVQAWFREHIPGFGAAAGPKTFSEGDLKRIAGEAIAAATAPLTSKIAELETTLGQQTAAFSERETRIAGGEVKQRAVEAVNRLKSTGKWIPAFEKLGLAVVFDELAKNTQTVEFGEGAAKKSVTPLEMLVTFLEGFSQIVPGGTRFTGATQTRGAASNDDPLTAAAKARQRDKGISFSDALDQIVIEQPELALPGAGRAGAV
jgi:hypothetical protein